MVIIYLVFHAFVIVNIKALLPHSVILDFIHLSNFPHASFVTHSLAAKADLLVSKLASRC